MIHYNDSIHRRIAACILLLVPAALFTPAIHAADEEIDIPYTDTYGYVYDPATGTFIKPDTPAATTDNSNTAQTADASTPAAGHAAPDTATLTPPAQSSPTTTAEKSWLPLALVLLAIAAAIGYRLLGRKNTDPADPTESRT